MTTPTPREATEATREPFDPGRKRLARDILTGLTHIRDQWRSASPPSDDYIAGWLSGFLGAYANAAESHGADAERAARAPGSHPDDGHAHWYACIRCGVDNGLNEAARAPGDGLREALEGLRALSEAATPGPWEYNPDFPNEVSYDYEPLFQLANGKPEDVEFIAAAVNYVRAALASPGDAADREVVG